MNTFRDIKVAERFYGQQPVASTSQIYVGVDRTCCCCRTKDVPLIKLSSCSHNGYLMYYFINKINLAKAMLCLYCHNMLKKIKRFKKQVDQCNSNSIQPISAIIIKTLQLSEIMTITINSEDEKPTLDNNIFMPETLEHEINTNFKEEYLSDESTKSDIEDVNQMVDSELDDEVLEPASHVHTVEKMMPNVMKLPEVQLPNVDLNYPISDSVIEKKPVLINNPIKTVKKVQMELGNKPSYSISVIMLENLKAKSGTQAIQNIQPNSSNAVVNPAKKEQRKVIVKYAILPNFKKVVVPLDTSKNDKFECRICSAAFDIEAAYDNHMKEHEKARSDLYGKIQIIYFNRKEMELEREKRMLKEYAKYDHKCEDCLSSFLHEESLKNHMKKHDASNSKYVCEVCKCVYVSEAGLKTHGDYHWRRFKCMECGEKFVQDKGCIEHYKKEHGKDGKRIDYSYACQFMGCDYIANDYSSFKRHVRGTHCEKVPCNICGNLFTCVTSMRRHVMKIHEKKHRIYKCKECDKQYKNIGGLLLHTRAHHKTTNEEMAYCKMCDKLFIDKSYLDTHLRTHSRHISDEQKKFVCDICGERFVYKPTIRSHIEMKHSQVPFQCKECDKILSSTRALRKHMWGKHSDVPRPPPPEQKLCQICGKAFKHTISLKSHMYSHTGERPLQCSRCPATFAYKASLYTHNRLVHKVPKKNKQIK